MAEQTAPAGIRVFNVLAGITTLAVFLQAISAGLFMALRDAGDGWVTMHAVVGYIAILLAVATAVIAGLGANGYRTAVASLKSMLG